MIQEPPAEAHVGARRRGGGTDGMGRGGQEESDVRGAGGHPRPIPPPPTRAHTHAPTPWKVTISA